MPIDVAAVASVFCAGLLAEVAIRFGGRGPLGRLEQRAHIAMRQGLIRTLRVLVPVLFAATLLSGVAATIVHWGDVFTPIRCGSIVLLLLFIAVTLFGTVPINKGAIEWEPENPPISWQAAVRR